MKPASPGNEEQLENFVAEEGKNARCFWAIKWLIYISAPVLYVDIVQAALCDKLGASKTVASLPSSGYFLGAVAPLLTTWLVPSSGRAKSVVITVTVATSILLFVVFVALILPFSAPVRIAVIVVQGILLGFLGYTQQIFLWHCLAAGTGLVARGHALRMAYSVGPFFAVAGSLGAQFLLRGSVSFLRFPFDFAGLYFVGAFAMMASALIATRFGTLTRGTAEPQAPVAERLWAGVRDYFRNRDLTILWIGLFLWYIALGGTPNLSLYVSETMQREPREFSGVMMALRFGAKALAGALYASLFVRYGARSALAVAISFLGLAFIWASIVPGYGYLLAFGFVGAGELGNAYFMVYGMSVAAAERTARNLSILTLTGLFSSVGPALHGALTDKFGFGASFLLGSGAGLLGLMLILILSPDHPAKKGDRERFISPGHPDCS